MRCAAGCPQSALLLPAELWDRGLCEHTYATLPHSLVRFAAKLSQAIPSRLHDPIRGIFLLECWRLRLASLASCVAGMHPSAPVEWRSVALRNYASAELGVETPQRIAISTSLAWRLYGEIGLVNQGRLYGQCCYV